MPTKTTATKKAAAKTPSKSKSTAKTPAKALVYANNESCFWVTDGQILNSLAALRDAFSNMPKDVYAYHVSSDKNDFATWVEVVLCDGDCALDLRKAKTPTTAKTAVAKHLKNYAT